MLSQTGYDGEKTKFLVKGFLHGFSLKYKGPEKVKVNAPNLKLRIGNKFEIWNKVMTEVKARRYAGPFKEIPYDYYIQSPIGLVPKDGGKKTRLIFHLSHPRSGETCSVNRGIPEEECKVKYPDFTKAVELCILAGKNCFAAKSDMSMAFRQVPMSMESWRFLILKAQHPITGEWFFFVDKCMPFGASISCKIFTEISNGIAHIVKVRIAKDLVNYLDDYFFAALLKSCCDSQVQMFLDICEEICFPVSLEKTHWGSTLLTFLGMLLDTENQLVCLPIEKVSKAKELIEFFVNRKNKKATVLQVQRLTGFLNFLSKAIVPGCTFTRRLYSSVSSNMKPHYHVRITNENRLDLEIWRTFLEYPLVFNRPFLDMANLYTSIDLDMYSDASGGIGKGFGAYCKNSWCYGIWCDKFMNTCNPSIEYLELYAVTVGVLLWIKRFQNQRICLFCDNDSVVKMLNKCSSGCKNCMVLLRFVALEAMVRNVKISAKWVATDENGKADAISRLDWARFKKLSNNIWMKYLQKFHRKYGQYRKFG